MVKDHCRNIFVSPNENCLATFIFDIVVVKDVHNANLVTYLKCEKFKLVVGQMHPNKVSGPDGPNLLIVITKNQPAFILGKNITDNVLIEFEVIQFLK